MSDNASYFDKQLRRTQLAALFLVPSSLLSIIGSLLYVGGFDWGWGLGFASGAYFASLLPSEESDAFFLLIYLLYGVLGLFGTLFVAKLRKWAVISLPIVSCLDAFFLVVVLALDVASVRFGEGWLAYILLIVNLARVVLSMIFAFLYARLYRLSGSGR